MKSLLNKTSFILLVTSFLTISCTNSEKSSDNIFKKESRVELTHFKKQLEKERVEGTILIYDSEKRTYYSNDYDWANSGFLPASTFKIPNSIIALETGIVESDTTVLPWDGQSYRFKVWEQDLTFRDAFHFSCVPCYRKIAREVGIERMRAFLDKLDYKSMVVQDTNLDLFWLEGQSRITPFEQIRFLKRLNNTELPISNRTEEIIKKMMIITENDSIVLRGKTGWSNDHGKNNGWFVGYIERDNNVFYFATNIEPVNGLSIQKFAELRKTLTYKVLEDLFSRE